MNPANIQIEESWKALLKEEFEQAYFDEVVAFLKVEKNSGKVIYPPGPLIFKAFELTPVDKLKVVIIGQDPYHNPGEAMGLSFSVPKGVRVPPSLRNIYKEMLEDIESKIPEHGDLTSWSNQGVLLLNAMLTVEHKSPGSHKKIGWQNFTNAVIQQISNQKENIVFLLWGNFAKGKKELIDETKHLILEAAHPSPLAGGAYFGSRHFSKTNNYLLSKNISPIEWNLS